MSDEVKFGITKDPWPWNETIDVSVMENRGVTGIWYWPTGEVIAARNIFQSPRAGSSVCVVKGGQQLYLVSAEEPYVAPTGPQS
jgi:hypothetical protein